VLPNGPQEKKTGSNCNWDFARSKFITAANTIVCFYMCLRSLNSNFTKSGPV
jgi:hypothetical protein